MPPGLEHIEEVGEVGGDLVSGESDLIKSAKVWRLSLGLLSELFESSMRVLVGRRSGCFSGFLAFEAPSFQNHKRSPKQQ